MPHFRMDHTEQRRGAPVRYPIPREHGDALRLTIRARFRASSRSEVRRSRPTGCG
jgi:hypothetical protein